MSEKSNATMEMVESHEAKSLNPNDVDVKTDNEKKKSTIKYFLDLLSDSIVTGVPQIVTASNLLRKIFKILVLGACIGGFIYQAVEFMELYKTYPSSLEIEVKYSRNLPDPAVTICNRNPVQRKQFCEAKKELCAKPTNLSRFCEMYPHHCNENTTLDDLEFVISNMYIKDEDVERFAHKAEDVIAECCYLFFPYSDKCRNHSKKSYYFNENNVKQSCYVINFAKFDIEGTYSNLEEGFAAGVNNCLWWSPLAMEQSYSVMVNLDNVEIVRPDVEPSIQAVVHSSSDFKNPFQKGFTMEAGKQYIVTMRAFEEYLQPAPYSTNCTKNEELDEDYNRENCILNCTIGSFTKECGCVPLFFLDSSAPICDKNSSGKCMQTVNIESCFHRCPRPCHSLYFEYEVASSNYENTIKAIDLGDGPIYKDDDNTSYVKERSKFNGKGKSFLRIVYSKKEITIFKYKPKYEKIEILGYIGGFSGIWLGVSLVAILDFVETIIVFFWYLAKNSAVKKDYSSR